MSQVRTIWHDDIGHRVQTKYGAATDGVLVSAVVGVPEPYFTNQPLDYTLLCDTQWLTTSDDVWHPFGASKLDIVTEGTEPYSAYSLRHRYPVGNYNDPLTTCYAGNVTTMEMSTKMQEVYVGCILKKSSNWQDHITTTSPKLCFILDSDFGGGGDPFLFIAGTDDRLRGAIQAQAGNPIYPGRGMYPNITTEYMLNNTWCHIEVIVKMNSVQLTDIYEDQTSDGEFHMWMDGVKTHQFTDVWFSNVANPKFDIVNFNPLWGGLGGEITEEMYLYNNHTRVAYKV